MSSTHRFDEHRREMAGYVGDYTGRASRWGERNLPGGALTLWIGLGLIVIFALLWVLRPAATLTAPTGRGGLNGPMPIGVANVASGNVNVTRNALGTVTPLSTVTVRPQVSGNILKIDFQEGKMVKAGDVLAEIDPRTYVAALDQAKGQLARDEAALSDARLDFNRYQNLVAQGAISTQQRDTQRALVHQDEGTVNADKANVQSAAINLGYTKIVSPITGRAGIRQVDIGNLVESGQTSQIVVVTQEQPISVLFSLPEDDLTQIMRQVNQGASLVVDAYDRAQTTKLATGTLSAVDSQIDTTTGTVKMRAMFDNQDGALFPQQFVNVTLRIATLRNQVVVPSAAIQRGSSGSFVYVVNKDSTVTVRTIATGVTDGDTVDVTSGLKPGQVVVVDGADRLTDGSQVILPKGQHGTGTAASNAQPGAPAAQADRRAQLMKTMRKLTPDECTQLKAMAREDRRSWIKAHMSELMKRQDQPGGACKLFAGGRSGGGGGGGGQ